MPTHLYVGLADDAVDTHHHSTGEDALQAFKQDVHDVKLSDELVNHTGEVWLRRQYKCPPGGPESYTGSWSTNPNEFSHGPTWGYNAVSRNGVTLHSGTIKNRLEHVWLDKGRILWPKRAPESASPPSTAEQSRNNQLRAPTSTSNEPSQTARPYQATVEDVSDEDGWEVVQPTDATPTSAVPLTSASAPQDSFRKDPNSNSPISRSNSVESLASTDQVYIPQDSHASLIQHSKSSKQAPSSPAADSASQTGSQNHN